MSTWILIFYMSTSTHFNFATGGPAVVAGLKSAAQCEAVLKDVGKMQKFDWGKCVEVKP